MHSQTKGPCDQKIQWIMFEIENKRQCYHGTECKNNQPFSKNPVEIILNHGMDEIQHEICEKHEDQKIWPVHIR